MKLQLTFKTPHAVEDAIEQKLNELREEGGYSEEELEDRRYSLEEAASKFVQYSEYVTIEIDTEASVATVRKVKD